jgi:hypothetical protein
MQRAAHLHERFEQRAERKVGQHAEKFELAARVGWVAKGALYVTLGGLALLAAFGEGGALRGGRGVLQWVAGQPFGKVLLGLAGVGFALYALVRLLQSIVLPDRSGDRRSKALRRVGHATSAVVYGALAVAAFQILNGNGAGGGRSWLSQVMHAGTWGVLFVGLIGAIIVVVGLYQFKPAIDLDFMDEVDTARMSQREIAVLKVVGRAGLAARGVVFPIIGYFLIVAAKQHDASEAKDVGGALGELARTSWIALTIIAAGLVAYGILQLFFAKYRRVQVPGTASAGR